MGVAAGPGGPSAPKLNIDPAFWAAKSQADIFAELVRRKRYIETSRSSLGPANPNNIATAFDIQRTQEDVRVLSALLDGPCLVASREEQPHG